MLGKFSHGDFMLKEYNFAENIYRILAQIVYYNEYAEQFHHQIAVFNHFLTTLHYIMYMNIYEYTLKSINDPQKCQNMIFLFPKFYFYFS